MINICNGRLIARIDETKFAYQKSRGRLKGWREMTMDDYIGDAVNPDIPPINDLSIGQIKEMLTEKHIPFKKDCKSKVKLYNILVHT